MPAIAHSLLQTLVFVVDRVMLGRHGEASLAAMQIGGALEWSIWSVFAAFEVGTIARVGRHVGAGDSAGARRVAWLSLAMAACVGVALALATPLVLAALPLVTGSVSDAAMTEARAYLGVTIAASPLVFVAATSTATLQAGGDTRTPLVIGVVANVVHVGLNRVLILGAFGLVPAMGARGAGISTAITFAIEAALATLALTSRSRPVSLRAAPGAGDAAGEDAPASPRSRPAREEARQLVRIGLPAFAERVIYHVGFMVYAFVVVRLGDAAMAANQSLISVESICFLSADGFGVAAAALVAQKLGAGKPDEARSAAWIAARYAIVTLTTFGLGALALRDVILPIFSGDAGVIAIGRSAMPVLAVAQPFMATGLVLAQALRGAGKTRQALGVSLLGAVFVRLTATWGFTVVAGLGLVGVWMGSTTDWLVRAAILAALFRRRGAASREPASAPRLD
ncbi:MAG: MATE family efflux transporter [Labilithrix sp.]|nr:MATE family efflux transporter [Labilithrix sp.]